MEGSAQQRRAAQWSRALSRAVHGMLSRVGNGRHSGRAQDCLSTWIAPTSLVCAWRLRVRVIVSVRVRVCVHVRACVRAQAWASQGCGAAHWARSIDWCSGCCVSLLAWLTRWRCCCCQSAAMSLPCCCPWVVMSLASVLAMLLAPNFLLSGPLCQGPGGRMQPLPSVPGACAPSLECMHGARTARGSATQAGP